MRTKRRRGAARSRAAGAAAAPSAAFARAAAPAAAARRWRLRGTLSVAAELPPADVLDVLTPARRAVEARGTATRCEAECAPYEGCSRGCVPTVCDGLKCAAIRANECEDECPADVCRPYSSSGMPATAACPPAGGRTR